MTSKLPIKVIVFVLVLASLACGLSDITGATSPPQQPGQLETAVARSLAETAGMQTAIAQGVAGTINPGQQVIPQNSTQAQPGLPSLTPSPQLSFPSEKPLVSVSQVTNCRSGPGSNYDWLGALNVDQQVEVFGRDPSNISWYIRNPDNSSGFCWIYGAYATVTGNTSAILVFTPMPTPTPAKTATSTTAPIDFIVTFLKFDVCGGIYYARYNLYNNSSVTWQSYLGTTTDTVSTKTVTSGADKFTQFSACALVVSQDDLAPGESGEANTSYLTNLNPSGHLISTSIKLCTLDGMGGTCLTKTFSSTAP